MRDQQANHSKRTCLWDALCSGGECGGQIIAGSEATVFQRDLIEGSTLYNRAHELCGQNVLLATTSQFTTASALIELDGLARRIVVCPPDLPLDRLPYVMETAEVDAIVSDRNLTHFGSRRPLILSP